MNFKSHQPKASNYATTSSIWCQPVLWDFTDPDSPRSNKSRSTSDEPTFCTCSTFRVLFCFKSWLPFLLSLAMCTAANTSLNFVTMPLNSVSVVGMVKHRYRCFSLLLMTLAGPREPRTFQLLLMHLLLDLHVCYSCCYTPTCTQSPTNSATSTGPQMLFALQRLIDRYVHHHDWLCTTGLLSVQIRADCGCPITTAPTNSSNPCTTAGLWYITKRNWFNCFNMLQPSLPKW